MGLFTQPRATASPAPHPWQWEPDGAEPRMCPASAVGDPACASGHAWSVRSITPQDPAAECFTFYYVTAAEGSYYLTLRTWTQLTGDGGYWLPPDSLRERPFRDLAEAAAAAEGAAFHFAMRGIRRSGPGSQSW